MDIVITYLTIGVLFSITHILAEWEDHKAILKFLPVPQLIGGFAIIYVLIWPVIIADMLWVLFNRLWLWSKFTVTIIGLRRLKGKMPDELHDTLVQTMKLARSKIFEK